MRFGARVGVLVFLLWVILFATGCATVVKGRSQILAVNTDPEGANCTLRRNDETVGAVNPTPGTVQVSKSSAPIDIHCNRQGYLEATAKLSPSFQGWTLGNAVLGGIVGLAVDAGSGAINEYQSEILVKLAPESFPSYALRDAFFDERRAEVESNKNIKQADKELLLAEIDEMQKRVRIAGPGEEGDAKPGAHVPEVAHFPVHESPSPDERLSFNGAFRVGDQWKYRLTDGRRTVGTIVMTIADTKGNKIKERITQEGVKGFVVEREIGPDFDPTRFLDPVTLPGGYQLAELAPYFSQDAELKAGQVWKDIPGEFQIYVIGRRKLLSEVKVVGRENVRVPAGSFHAWKVKADVEEVVGAQGYRVKMTQTFWYAPESLRIVKMTVFANTSVIGAHTSTETYELVAMKQVSLQGREH